MAMAANVVAVCIPARSLPGNLHTRHRCTVGFRRLKCQATEEDSNESDIDPQAQVEALESKLRSSRKRRKRLESMEAVRISDLPTVKKKPWEQMSLGEKAWELYAGEKGALFWINKLAYAAIFAIVGGWIVFRFVGPALGLYQLDNALLPPDKVFTGS